MTLDELAEEACGGLPEGWELSISLMKDGGSVDLYNPERIFCPGAACCDDSLEQQVLQAIEYAKTNSH